MPSVRSLHRAYYTEGLYDQIFIEGHTDSSPIHTAQFPSNWHLSTARAVRVTDFFIEHGYLSPSLSKRRFLGAAGYGRILILLILKRKKLRTGVLKFCWSIERGNFFPW
jgi:hypothetical protein